MNTRSLSKRVERMPFLFEDIFNKPWSDWFDGGFPTRRVNMPAVNISEGEENYQVSMAAPGLQKEDFKISVDGNMLTISSTKEDENEEKDGKFTRREYSYSSFERSFTLPDEVNKDKIDAQYKDGVLQLVLPKKEEAKKATVTRQIAVK